MKQYKGTFNIYCDESCHLMHDNMPYMVIGFIRIPFNQLKEISRKLKTLKETYNLHGEIKWVNVSKSKSQFYIDLLDYIFSTDIHFKAIIVKKGLEAREFQDLNKYDTYFMTRYVRLIYDRMDLDYKYNIYFDIVDNIKSRRINKTRNSLKKRNGPVRTFQIMHSSESIYMQISDLIVGAISFKLRELHKRENASPTKVLILSKIDSLFKNSIDNVKLMLKNEKDYTYLEFCKNAIQSS